MPHVQLEDDGNSRSRLARCPPLGYLGRNGPFVPWGWEIPSGVADPAEDLPAAAARESLKESGWEPSQLSLLLRLEPSGGLTDSVAHVYWTRHAEYRGDPVAAFEAERIDWIPLREIPELIAGGQIRAAVTAASLLYLLQKLAGPGLSRLEPGAGV
jgi:8-oxo-dGTP pyrophosphatase MutT (NUDIX family)